jgi:hypothetical protein
MEWILVGFSFECNLALIFADMYKCDKCILMDPGGFFNPKNNTNRIKHIKQDMLNNHIIKTQSKFTQLIDSIMNNNIKSIDYLHDLFAYKILSYVNVNLLKNNHIKHMAFHVFYDITSTDTVIPEFGVSHNTEKFNDIKYLKIMCKHFDYTLFLDVGHIVYKEIHEVDIIINKLIN